MTTSRAHLETVLAQRRAAVPDRSVWVSASAGTGKTKVLTDRVLSLLLAGTPPQRILCLTFTRAAAAEMSNRINDRLGDWAADETVLEKGLTDLLGHAPDKATSDLARRLFAMVLDVPGGMKIQTIHAFCESLLHRFPLEAGLAPHFDVMDERTAIEALHAARDVVLARARHGQDEALADALAEVAGRVNEADFAELLQSLAGERGRLRRMLARHGGIAGYRAALYGVLEVGEGETDGAIVAAVCATGAFDEAGLRRACKPLSEGSKTDVERGAIVAGWLADEAAREAGLEAYARAFLTADGRVRKTLITKAAAAAAPEIPGILAAEAARLQVVDDRRRALVTAQATAALVALGRAWLDAYDEHKLAHARLDYDDLILRARALLEEDGAAAWVLYKLDGGIDHILIDEAQDTNPDQWAVVRALAEEFFAGEGAREVARTVFAVGDAKQSIYSFQRADPQSFAHMQVYFRQRVMAAGRKWDTVDLTMSFRSTPSVLNAVDTVFAQAPARVGVATAGEAIVHIPFREGQAGLVELWPAVEPREAPDPAPWAPPVERRPVDEPQTRLARVIAGRIGCWIDRNEMLESRNRPLRAGDIMVLVRRRTGFVDALIRALKQLNVPVAGVDRMVLSDQLAVKDLIVLGQFLLLPEDDLTLATVLKGPLFGLNEEELFQLAHGRSGNLWHELGRRAGKQPYRSAHQELADLLGRADFVPPFELYAHVLSRRGARHAITGRLGRDAGDPLDEFLSLALGFERNNAPSLQAFLHWIGAGEAEIKRDLEHGVRDEVRVMTVHGAKGLQAPIVFLPDTLQAPNRSPRLLWHGDDVLLWPPRRAFDGAVSRALRDEARSRGDEEYRRLLYVAMTRAEDRLYICGWHTRNKAPENCWYQMAEAALGPSAEFVEMDFTDDARGDGWQGAGLRLANKQDAPAEDSDHGRRFVPPPDEPPAWARQPAPPEDVPPRPLVPSRPDDAEPATRSLVGADRGAAFRRGNLIHRLLQTLPGIDPSARAAAARRYLALPAHGLAQDQRQALAAEVLAVLSAPEFADLFGPASRAEVPLTGCINQRVISGQVDRLVVADGRVRIIDYKSNRPPPAKIEDTPMLYLRQMAAYHAVLAEIYPVFSIDCAILWTDGPTLMGLPDTLLANYAP